jgi:uncharacterized small protein (DUF1192 family)
MENRISSVLARSRKFLAEKNPAVLAGAGLAAVLLLFLLTTGRNAIPSKGANSPSPDHIAVNTETYSAEANHSIPSTPDFSPSAAPSASNGLILKSTQPQSLQAYREPHVAYSAELSEVTKEFARSRSTLEEILDRHRGYVAKLRMVGQPTGSVLSATLRVPSTEYRPALSELKAVGLVEHEEESADEITQQHSELEARLVNAQNEEQRIQRLLQNRDDKVYDYGSLEQQVALLRNEIARIQAERSASASHVSFANVYFSLREERITPAESISARLRNAGASGLSDALDTLSTLLVFLASHSPVLALWAILLYLPVRFFWRRRAQLAFNETPAAKNS